MTEQYPNQAIKDVQERTYCEWVGGVELAFTKMQYGKVQDFIKNHKCEEFIEGAGGFGSTSKLCIVLGSTAIGCTMEIYCPYCKTMESITDIDLW